MNTASIKSIFALIATVQLAGLQAGCGSKSASATAAGGRNEFAVPVESARVTAERLEEKLNAVGSLEANEAVDIKSEIDAVVESVGFTEGAAVKKGQSLIQFDAVKWRAQYDVAKVAVENAKQRSDRSERLFKSDSVSQQEYDDAHANLKSAEANLALLDARLKETRIVAPFDGMISERSVSPGAYVKAGDTLVRLVDIDPIKISFGAPERYLPQLKLGQKVEVRVAALKDRIASGEVYFIDPQMDVMTRTVKVKAKTANKDGSLRPGLFANIELTLAVHEDALVIPEEAILAQTGATLVFVISNQQAMPRPVKTGLRVPGKVEIVEGLKQGEEVVTAGHQKLFPGVKVSTVTPKG